MDNQLTTRSNDFFSLVQINNFKELYEFAKMVSRTNFCPQDYKNKPEEIILAWQKGAKLGLDSTTSLENIAVINGKASIRGDALLAIVQRHPDFVDCIETIEGEGDLKEAHCTIKRKNRQERTVIFGVKNAKNAKLWGKTGAWTQYPERMLQMRARGFALRDMFADALFGVITREEAQDYEIKDVTPNSHSKSEESSDVENKPAALIESGLPSQNDGDVYKHLFEQIAACNSLGELLDVQNVIRGQSDLIDSELLGELRDKFKEKRSELEIANEN